VFGYLKPRINEICIHLNMHSHTSVTEVNLDAVLGRLCEVKEKLSQFPCTGVCGPLITHFSIIVAVKMGQTD